ncbi:MAG TPA: hypothetical protein VLH79_14900 [Chthonomonadales bacterium]|nr:hypothetical protein [Chthonomonadales bacterium]
MHDWPDDLPDAERDELVDTIARHVVSRGLETPAVLLLEMHRPISFMASQGLVVLTPLLGPLIGLGTMQRGSLLLEKRENVERLIERIEHLAQDRMGRERAERKARDAAR